MSTGPNNVVGDDEEQDFVSVKSREIRFDARELELIYPINLKMHSPVFGSCH